MNAEATILVIFVSLGAACCYWMFLAYLNPENVLVWSVLWSICG